MTQALFLLEEKVDLHAVAETYNEVEKQLTTAVAKVQNYLTEGIATPEEVKILKGLEQTMFNLQDLLLEIKKELESRLFLMDRAERNRKMLDKVFEEDEEEEARNAPMAQVPPA